MYERSLTKIAINHFSCVHTVPAKMFTKYKFNLSLVIEVFRPWLFLRGLQYNQKPGLMRKRARIFRGKKIIDVVIWHHNKRHSYFKLRLKVFVVAHHEFGNEKISKEKSQVRRVPDHSIRDLAQFGRRNKRLVSYGVKKYFSFLFQVVW